MNLKSHFDDARGTFTITAGNDARAILTEVYRRGGNDAVESELAEYGLNGANGGLSFFPIHLIPDAMTEMPALAEWAYDDDGGVSIWGIVYGFPDYCVRDPWGELRTIGRVEFVAVADYGPDGAKMPARDSNEARAINSEAYDKLLQGWQPSYPPASTEATAG